MTKWVVSHLGPDVPMHFTAFHPDYKMLDVPPTPAATLTRARTIAIGNGVRYAYTGNVPDVEGQSTSCHQCGALLIARSSYGYEVTAWRLDAEGRCPACGTACAGVFAAAPGRWGPRRRPVRLSDCVA
jgi:pyruvate formate lyase activating enzyme